MNNKLRLEIESIVRDVLILEGVIEEECASCFPTTKEIIFKMILSSGKRGVTSREVGYKIGISPKTANQHLNDLWNNGKSEIHKNWKRENCGVGNR